MKRNVDVDVQDEEAEKDGEKEPAEERIQEYLEEFHSEKIARFPSPGQQRRVDRRKPKV
jgi:hypothetical protein